MSDRLEKGPGHPTNSAGMPPKGSKKVAKGSEGSKKPHAQQSNVRLELGSTRLPHSQQHMNFPALLLSGVRKKANKKMQQGKGSPRKSWVREPFLWKQR